MSKKREWFSTSINKASALAAEAVGVSIDSNRGSEDGGLSLLQFFIIILLSIDRLFSTGLFSPHTTFVSMNTPSNDRYIKSLQHSDSENEMVNSKSNQNLRSSLKKEDNNIVPTLLLLSRKA